jgi:hypothetical protein
MFSFIYLIKTSYLLYKHVPVQDLYSDVSATSHLPYVHRADHERALNIMLKNYMSKLAWHCDNIHV